MGYLGKASVVSGNGVVTVGHRPALYRTVQGPVAFTGAAGRDRRFGEHMVERFRGHSRSLFEFSKGGFATWLKTKN